MNIFVTNEDPILSAKDLMDKHVVKQSLETAQILSTVAQLRGFTAPYKVTHAKHPATRWVMESSANWHWLCLHGKALCEEYTSRYGKVHKCQAIIEDLWQRTLEIWGEAIPATQHTPFVQCMPDEYKADNAVEAYRAYYMGPKSRFASWKYPSQPPKWYIGFSLIK